jgi:hypothetical protein
MPVFHPTTAIIPPLYPDAYGPCRVLWCCRGSGPAPSPLHLPEPSLSPVLAPHGGMGGMIYYDPPPPLLPHPHPAAGEAVTDPELWFFPEG